MRHSELAIAASSCILARMAKRDYHCVVPWPPRRLARQEPQFGWLAVPRLHHPGPGGAACGGDRLGQCGCDNDCRTSFQIVAPAGQAGEEATCDTGA